MQLNELRAETKNKSKSVLAVEANAGLIQVKE